jgi:hypothetical protein
VSVRAFPEPTGKWISKLTEIDQSCLWAAPPNRLRTQMEQKVERGGGAILPEQVLSLLLPLPKDIRL